MVGQRAAAGLALLAACSGPPAPTRAEVYARAVAAARSIDGARARLLAPALAALLARPDAEGWLHRAAVEALGRGGLPRALAPLGRVIEAPPRSVEFFLRRLAARAVGRIGRAAGGGEDAARAAALLAGNLDRAEDGLTLEQDCRAALAEIGPAARAALEEAVGAADPRRVAAAARALGALGGPAALAALERALASARAGGPTRRAIEEAIAAIEAARRGRPLTAPPPP